MSLQALLFTDVVDSTLLTQRLGDARARQTWIEHDRRARELLRRHRGREIDRADGFFLLFDAAADAARYAQDYHALLAALDMTARVGLHVGDVSLREIADDDVAQGAKRIEIEGLAKPFAARVMSMAHGGQTLLSDAARRAIGGALDAALQIESHGHRRTPTRPTASCTAAICGARCARCATTCRPSATPSSAAARTCVRSRSGSTPAAAC